MSGTSLDKDCEFLLYLDSRPGHDKISATEVKGHAITWDWGQRPGTDASITLRVTTME